MNVTGLKRLSQGVLILMAAAMLDTCATAIRSPARMFTGLPGETVTISGKLEGRVVPAPVKGSLLSENRITDPAVLALLIRAEAESAMMIGIRFIERNGRLWRAVMQIHPDARLGEYGFYILQPGEARVPEHRYRVRVYADAAERDRAAASFAMRYLGIDPWWIALGLIPPAIAMLAASWRLSRSEEERLRRLGIAPIYKLAHRKDHWELSAGLGSRDGVRPGERVRLLSRDLTPITDIRAGTVHADYLDAEVGLDVPVTPHCFVSRGAPDPAADGRQPGDP